mgnify:CR=1 FL=1
MLVFNKMDQKNAVCPEKIKDIPVLGVSARTKAGITELKETIAKAAKQKQFQNHWYYKLQGLAMVPVNLR